MPQKEMVPESTHKPKPGILAHGEIRLQFAAELGTSAAAGVPLCTNDIGSRASVSGILSGLGMKWRPIAEMITDGLAGRCVSDVHRICEHSRSDLLAGDERHNEMCPIASANAQE